METTSPTSRRLIVVGAGPAGLTAACAAQEAGWSVTVLEKDPEYVGGLSRTVRYKGWRFDIGGHRFFSKSPEIVRWWRERLPDDFVSVRRLSRIFYRRKFFDYPLKPWNALRNLGVFASFACVMSYAWARLFPRRPERSFEDWVTNRFGRRLFATFFKTYTEKVWGIPTSELSADWAAQRIKGLSLSKAIVNAFRRPKAAGADGAVIKTLIDTFDYPRLGPGQMWERAAADLAVGGGKVELGAQMTRIVHRDSRVVAVDTQDAAGRIRRWEGDEFVISAPLQETVLAFEPPLAVGTIATARDLHYRDFLTVALIVEGANLFPDNWLYIHDPSVQLGRIQNYRNWSSAMLATLEADATCLGLEYFCFAGDGLWTRSDAELVALGTRELKQLGLVTASQVRDGAVVRVEKAYPVYDPGYREKVDAIRDALAPFSNLQVVGRNGMHKYNNQDHSMMTGLLAVKNLQGGRFNLWNVNADAEYHESGEDEDRSGRLTPKRLSS